MASARDMSGELEAAGSRRYRIVRTIKRGVASELLEGVLAGEGAFERRVAIKRLLPSVDSDESFIAGFMDEARIASRLHHANIVGVSDFGVSEGRPFLVLEFVDGLDLADLEELAPGGRIPLELGLYISIEIAHALAYAHEAV